MCSTQPRWLNYRHRALARSLSLAPPATAPGGGLPPPSDSQSPLLPYLSLLNQWPLCQVSFRCAGQFANGHRLLGCSSHFTMDLPREFGPLYPLSHLLLLSARHLGCSTRDVKALALQEALFDTSHHIPQPDHDSSCLSSSSPPLPRTPLQQRRPRWTELGLKLVSSRHALCRKLLHGSTTHTQVSIAAGKHRRDPHPLLPRHPP